jgi:hypothetical protein
LVHVLSRLLHGQSAAAAQTSMPTAEPTTNTVVGRAYAKMSCNSVIMGPSELSPSRRRRTLRLDDGMMPPNVRQVLGENLNCSESGTASRVFSATVRRKSPRAAAVALTKELPETL